MHPTTTATPLGSPTNINTQYCPILKRAIKTHTLLDTKILQINLQKAKAPTSLLQQTVTKHNINILLVQEPYIINNKIAGIPTTWKVALSKNNKAAVITTSSSMHPILTLRTDNTIIVKIKINNETLKIGSSYIAPTTQIDQPLNEILANTTQEDTFIGADWNAHSTTWGYNNEDVKGRKVLDFLAASQLLLLNTQGAPPSFEAFRSKGWPDLTMSTPNIARIAQWQVLDDITLSDHKYILTTLSTNTETITLNRFKTKHGNHNKFIKKLATHAERLMLQIQNITTTEQLETATEELQTTLQTCSQQAYKIKHTQLNKDTTWWNAKLDIEKKRIAALRRRWQKETDTQLKKTREERYRKERAQYVNAINSAKKQHWKQFCTNTKTAYTQQPY